MALSASSCTVATTATPRPLFARAIARRSPPLPRLPCSCFRQQWNDMKRHETARHETKRNGFKTERHDCQKRQRNRTVNTVLQNDTERFWKRFFDAYCTCMLGQIQRHKATQHKSQGSHFPRYIYMYSLPRVGLTPYTIVCHQLTCFNVWVI